MLKTFKTSLPLWDAIVRHHVCMYVWSTNADAPVNELTKTIRCSHRIINIDKCDITLQRLWVQPYPSQERRQLVVSMACCE